VSASFCFRRWMTGTVPDEALTVSSTGSTTPRTSSPSWTSVTAGTSTELDYLKTTTGPVTLSRPKLRGTTEAFASRLFGAHVTKTNALESLVIASFVRGLSVRDAEAALAEALGDQAAVSKSTVSSVCQAIRDEYARWAARRLDDVTLDYLSLDASFFRMHSGSPAELVLAAWGITTGGKPAFIGLAAAADAISGQRAGTPAAHLALVAPRQQRRPSASTTPLKAGARPRQAEETRRTRMTTEPPASAGPVAEALCLTEDADWETIAKKLGGRLGNREIADTGEYETLLIVPAPPETPVIACLCGSTRFYDQFQRANYDLTMRGEIVLSVGFYPHATAEHGNGEGVGRDSAEKTALDELHKRKIDLADYVLVVSDETGYFGESTEGEIRYAAEHGKPVRFAEPAAARRARWLGLAAAGEQASR
jgi:hypothetical protein